jgi:hypothetical protein
LLAEHVFGCFRFVFCFILHVPVFSRKASSWRGNVVSWLYPVRGRCLFLLWQCRVSCFVCGGRACLTWHCGVFRLTNVGLQCTLTWQNCVLLWMSG